jgi:uncharacterized membrane protein YphA (DoxX/SURF4 family)
VASLVSLVWALIVRTWVRWFALLAVGATCLRGGDDKTVDLDGASAELLHFGLTPATPLTLPTIVLELGASLLILTGICRWFGALTLVAFTLDATFVANRYWKLAPPGRAMLENEFSEHFGLVGTFVLVAWTDLPSRKSAS